MCPTGIRRERGRGRSKGKRLWQVKTPNEPPYAANFYSVQRKRKKNTQKNTTRLLNCTDRRRGKNMKKKKEQGNEEELRRLQQDEGWKVER